MNQTLRWMAAGLALFALFFLPALRASVPLLPQTEWTVAQLGGEAFHAAAPTAQGSSRSANLGRILRQARAVIEQWGGSSARSEARLDWALALAVLIPAMAIVAGLCVLGCVALLALRRRRWLTGVAAVGCAATVYAMAASWWLTRAAHNALTQMLQQAQHRFSHGLLGALNWGGLAAGVGELRLAPQIGLYLLLLAFLIFLALPGDESPLA